MNSKNKVSSINNNDTEFSHHTVWEMYLNINLSINNSNSQKCNKTCSKGQQLCYALFLLCCFSDDPHTSVSKFSDLDGQTDDRIDDQMNGLTIG